MRATVVLNSLPLGSTDRPKSTSGGVAPFRRPGFPQKGPGEGALANFLAPEPFPSVFLGLSRAGPCPPVGALCLANAHSVPGNFEQP